MCELGGEKKLVTWGWGAPCKLGGGACKLGVGKSL